MVCQACNAVIGPEGRFCPKCGSPVATPHIPPQQAFVSGYPPGYAPPLAPRRRVMRNLQALGVLWCLFGAYRIIGGLLGVFFLHAFASHAFGDWPFGARALPIPNSWIEMLLPVIATVTVLSAALAFVTAYGLLSRRPWGRTLAIVAAVLALFKFPMGTALGIYTLWVLAPGDSGLEYDAITAQPATL